MRILQKYQEKNKLVSKIEMIAIILLIIGSLFCFGIGFNKLNKIPDDLVYVGTIEMVRDYEYEDYDQDYTICDVRYYKGDKQLIISYSYQEYLELATKVITAYEYSNDSVSLIFEDDNPTREQIEYRYREMIADDETLLFNLGSALLILSLSISIVYFFGLAFTAYEKTWFISIMVLATIFAAIFPEESANGVNGIIIMLLYLFDTFFNILCELLISKQSRYNFLVSVLVEIVEIAICLVLMYRFATMVTTLFFWLPIDIVSFINWTKHKDEKEDELTIVRKLKGYQEALVILGIVIWTIVIGYLISGLNISSDFFNDRSLETIVAYLDACASAVGIANGLFIFFRLQEQWIAWYLCALLESIINIISGQYVLLVLKLGYFTNTTYGYIKWNRYIKEHREDNRSLF